MKLSKVLENKVKEIILSNNGKSSLNNPVIIKHKTYIGYNYDKNEHEYAMYEWKIKEVLRDGKKGVVYVSDGINQWRPSELSDAECEAIMKEIA